MYKKNATRYFMASVTGNKQSIKDKKPGPKHIQAMCGPGASWPTVSYEANVEI